MNFELSAERCNEFLAHAGVTSPDSYEVRQIGTDAKMVELIMERILIGEKTMTYSLPWIAERTGRSELKTGHYLVVVDAGGSPCLLLQITKVVKLVFGEICEDDLTCEGIPMRSLDAWKPLHTNVWNYQLAPFGLSVKDEMPVCAEYFKLIYTTKSIPANNSSS